MAKKKPEVHYVPNGFVKWAEANHYYLGSKPVLSFPLGQYERLTSGYQVHFSNVKPLSALYEYYLRYGKQPFVSQFDQPDQSSTHVSQQGGNSWTNYPWKVARAKAMKGRCYLCAEPLEGMSCNMDHVTPKSKDGPDIQDNQLVAHELCNSLKGNRMPTKRELECLKKVNMLIALNRKANGKDADDQAFRDARKLSEPCNDAESRGEATPGEDVAFSARNADQP